MPVIKIKKNSLTKAQFGFSNNFAQGLGQAVQQLQKNAPQEDAKAARLADQPFYNPFDVKWGQQQSPQIDITGEYSNKPFDQYATSVNNSSTPSRGSLNLPQLVNTNVLSQENKSKSTNKGGFDYSKLAKMANIGMWSGVGLNAAGAAFQYFDDKKKQKDFDRNFRQQSLPDNMYAVSPGGDRGDFDINEGIYRPNQLTPPNIGATVAQYGGTQSLEDMNLIKIRLNSSGQMMKYGGQSGYGLDIGQRRVYTEMPKGKDEEVSNTLNPIPREQANIEAEKGETAYGDMDGDGALEHFNIGGKRHTQGGTPLNVPEGSFIFSDTKKMIIKDPAILEKFGMTIRKEGYTPAEIAKKYDVNKYKAVMEDPNTDYVRKNTAQIMIKSFQKKLAELAIIQESMKGFPQGIPEIAKQTNPELAEKYAKEFGLEEEALEDEANQQEQVMEEGMTEPEEEMMGEEEQMMEQPEEQYMEEEPMPEAEYGGSRLPSYQGATKGSTVSNNGRFPVWDPEYQDVISGYIKDKYDVKVPINARDQANTNRFTLPSMQSSRGGKRVYGEEAWTDAEHMADFAERQEDFLKENPNWDPTKSGATKKFQEWYNNKAKELNLPQYFGKGQRFQGLDDKFGEYTFSAPSLSPKRPPEPVKEKIIPPPTPFYRPNKMQVTGKPVKTPYGWMTPDVVNLAAASAIAPRKDLPYIAPAQYEAGRVSLEDWRAKAAARQAMYNKQADVMGVYGPTTGQGASQSFAAGQQAEGLVGDIASTNSRNVDRVNQFLQGERQRKDQFNLLGANRATELYKGNVVANQQYDNARRQYLNNIAKTFGQGWKNASQLGMLNAVNPMYKVNPFSGRSYFTDRGKNFSNFSRSSGQSMATSFPALKNQYMAMRMKEDNAEKMAIKALTGGKGNTSANSAFDYVSEYNNVFNNPNPLS